MSTYRVDRNPSQTSTPCGMNSLLYLGDSHRQALRAFNAASPGINDWGQPNPDYGVTLAVWRGQSHTGDYIVTHSKRSPK
jgi:hypothetical protein